MRFRDKGRIDMQLAVAIFGLSVFGLLMLYSASAELSRVYTDNANNSTHYLYLQMVSYGLGLVAWLVVQQIDYHRYQKYSTAWLLITLILLVSVFLLSKGETKGAHRWVSIAGQTFQPSEFAKLSFIMFLASWFSQKRELFRTWKGFALFMLAIGSMGALMLAQKDLGSLGIMMIIALAMYVCVGARALQVSGVIASLIAMVVMAVKIAPYRIQRLTSFLNADSSPTGAGYHTIQAKIAIGLGGLWGKGFLRGVQKRGFLPEGHTDSIFAIIVEELGFLRSGLLIGVYGFIATRGARIAKYAPDSFGSLIAIGITVWFVGQALINIGSMTSLIPMTGVPLPFVSYGRSAMVALFMATGVILNVSRFVDKE